MKIMALLHITSRFRLNKHFDHTRNIVSALHIPGDVTHTVVSVLNPSFDHIDTLIAERNALKNSIEARELPINFETFETTWTRMKHMESLKNDLEQQRLKVSDNMKELVTQKGKDQTVAERTEELKNQGKHLRNKLKELNQVWWDVEMEAKVFALRLPNLLHRETPRENVVIRSAKAPVTEEGPSHQTSRNIDFVNFSPSAYYLKGGLARRELEYQRLFSRQLSKEGFVLISAPDFVKSIIIEGCGVDFNDSNQVLTLDGSQESGTLENGNALHLVGGASLPALVAFLTKNVIQSPLPLRFASSGRHYQPAKLPNDGLYGATQSSRVQFLSVLVNDADLLFDESQRICGAIGAAFDSLDVHYRICALPARQLDIWEQYRASIELYSPVLKRYLQISSVSIVGDYISRRLAIYGCDGQHPGFVSGVGVCVTSLLAALIENHRIC